MKKRNLLLYIILILLFVISGCSDDNSNTQTNNDQILSNQIEIDDKKATMVCTLDMDKKENEGYTLGAKYVIFSDKDIVTKVNSQEIVQSSNRELLETFEQYFQENYGIVSNYGGYEYEITNENGQVKSVVSIDYTKMDIENYINNYPDIKAYLDDNNQVTINALKDNYESLGATCNRK